MRILIVLTYYAPYVSGVTEFARMLAEFLAARHEVTVLATRHDPSLPAEETIAGVRVIRSPVAVRLHKGVLSPAFLLDFWRLARQADVVNLHLPMLEAGLLALCVDRRRLVSMFQCDLATTGGLVDRLAVAVTRLSAQLALARSTRVTVTTLDYARSSRIAGRYEGKLVEVRAPVKRPSSENVSARQSSGAIRIGFVGRFVEEKGLDVLLDAFEKLRRSVPERLELVLVGQASGVPGGSVLSEIDRRLEALGGSVTVTGKVSEDELWALYSSFDILALPSVNRYEAFGMVQVEAMLSGALVVASDLPGVKTIVESTGCGLIARRGDAHDLALKLAEAIQMRRALSRQDVSDRARHHYPPSASLELQERLFGQVAEQTLEGS